MESNVQGKVITTRSRRVTSQRSLLDEHWKHCSYFGTVTRGGVVWYVQGVVVKSSLIIWRGWQYDCVQSSSCWWYFYTSTFSCREEYFLMMNLSIQWMNLWNRKRWVQMDMVRQQKWQGSKDKRMMTYYPAYSNGITKPQTDGRHMDSQRKIPRNPDAA